MLKNVFFRNIAEEMLKWKVNLFLIYYYGGES